MVFNGVGLPGARRKRGFSIRRGGTPCSQAGAQGCQRLWLMHKNNGIGSIGICPRKSALEVRLKGKASSSWVTTWGSCEKFPGHRSWIIWRKAKFKANDMV